MKIRQRVLEEAKFVIANNATVRETASKFNVGKSTTHIDITTRLMAIDKKIASEVRKVLKQNRDEAPLRGGEATKRKYSGAK